MDKPRVVIVGGGFGGLAVARGLRKADVDVVLIDKTNYHLFQPLLYQVAIAALSPGDIATPFREIFRTQPNIRFLLDRVEAINCQQQFVQLSKERLSFDFLVLAPGSRPFLFEHEEWRQYVWNLKNLHDALDIRDHTLHSFEWAEHLLPHCEAQRYLTFAIVGGGPTGVEFAGALAETARYTIRPDFPSLRGQTIHIMLFERGPRLLGHLPARLSENAKQELQRLGVTVQLNCSVTDISRHGVQVDGKWIQTANILWAAGNQASPLLKTLNTNLEPDGRVRVTQDLSIPDYPSIFVIGDAACCLNESEDSLPGLAAVAMQQGRYVAHRIQDYRFSCSPEPFKYHDMGQMATIGKARAVANIKGLQVTGVSAWLLWSAVHVFFLIGFDKIRVIMEWIWFYFTYKSSERLIDLDSRPYK